MLHLTIDLITLAVAIPIGFIGFKKTNPPYLKALPFFLLLTFAVELLGEWLQGPGHNNVLLYNLFTVLEVTFYTWFFKSVIQGNKKVHQRILILLYLLPTLCLVNIFFIQGPKVFHTYSYCIASLVMVVLSITYFYHLFHDEKRVNLFREPAFWISIGILFFFISSVSVLGVVNYVSTLPKNISYLLQKLLLITNAFFYLLFIIAFLCRINIRKSLSS